MRCQRYESVFRSGVVGRAPALMLSTLCVVTARDFGTQTASQRSR
jgi:hypothetical protein